MAGEATTGDGSAAEAPEAGVEEDGESKERVMVNIRMELIDAMVSAEKEGELDVLAAVKLLSEHDDGFFVNVVEDDETVRIWIDSKSEIE